MFLIRYRVVRTRSARSPEQWRTNSGFIRGPTQKYAKGSKGADKRSHIQHRASTRADLPHCSGSGQDWPDKPHQSRLGFSGLRPDAACLAAQGSRLTYTPHRQTDVTAKGRLSTARPQRVFQHSWNPRIGLPRSTEPQFAVSPRPKERVGARSAILRWPAG